MTSGCPRVFGLVRVYYSYLLCICTCCCVVNSFNINRYFPVKGLRQYEHEYHSSSLCYCV